MVKNNAELLNNQYTNPVSSPSDAGAFVRAANELHQAGLALIPCGGADGKKPLVRWAKWSRPPGRRFLEKLVGQHQTANVGVLCGLSGLTIVDIDDPAVMREMIARFGDTPLITLTPSGGTHLWYRSNGEPCSNLRATEDGLAVDIKGKGGFIVVPPSVRPSGPHAGQAYTFLTGSWSDLPNLPAIRRGSLPQVERGTSAQPIPLRAVKEGRRNVSLFRGLLRQAHACDDFDALLDVAESFNNDLPKPLPDAEVRKTAQSVWRYETDGRNWVGQEARVTTLESEIDLLKANPDALTLMMILRVSHSARIEPFAIVAKAMAREGVIPRWGPRRYSMATQWLIGQGFLNMVYKGGHHKGDCNLFTLSSPIELRAQILRPI